MKKLDETFLHRVLLLNLYGYLNVFEIQWFNLGITFFFFIGSLILELLSKLSISF